MNVTLRRMTEDEFTTWLPRVRDGYAQDMVANGGADPDAAQAKAAEDTERRFPDGKLAADQLVFVIEAENERVGELWLSEQQGDFRRVMWVFDVHVDAQHRNRGIGRSAMMFAEQEAQRRGITHVGLNVFGGNEAARALYRSLGFSEVAVSMTKAVSDH